MTEARIAYPNDVLQAIAWRDCLAWAIGEPKILAAFTKETGMKVDRIGVERMIDEAVGYDHLQAVCDKFVDWFNANIWGEDPFR